MEFVDRLRKGFAKPSRQDDDTLTNGNPDDWHPILAVIAGAVAGAAWIGALGSAIVWLRLSEIGVAPAVSTSELPVEMRVVIGARYLIETLAVAIGVYVLLLVIRGLAENTQARDLNVRGQTPVGLLPCMILLVVYAAIAAFASRLTDFQQALVIGIAVIGAVLTYQLIRIADGFVKGSALFFAAIIAITGICGITIEALRKPHFPIAVVVRDDTSALGGFYLARTDAAVLLIAPRPVGDPGGSGVAAATGGIAAPPASMKRCSTTEQTLAPVKAASGPGVGCYVNALVSVDAEDVSKVIVGPRGQEVSPETYALARELAASAGAASDEAPPVKDRTAKASTKKSKETKPKPSRTPKSGR